MFVSCINEDCAVACAISPVVQTSKGLCSQMNIIVWQTDNKLLHYCINIHIAFSTGKKKLVIGSIDYLALTYQR